MQTISIVKLNLTLQSEETNQAKLKLNIKTKLYIYERDREKERERERERETIIQKNVHTNQLHALKEIDLIKQEFPFIANTLYCTNSIFTMYNEL